jgi:hypothetical protein
MRSLSLFQFAFAFAALVLPPASRAQKFQEPTRDELQMTSDPKAPGAPAVYLYREEKTDNANHTISEYARIKVLTELGKEWATVEVPYVPGYTAVPVIEGRTIHSDGTIVPLTGKPEELLVFKNHRNHLKAAVFTLPSAEVGSILEYRWTIPLGGGKVTGIRDEAEEGYYASSLASSIPEWEVQEPIFIHKEHFYYNPLGDLERNVIGNQSVTHYNSEGEIASYLLFSANLPGGAKLQPSPNRDYTLDLQDVPAFRPEAEAPPENGLIYRVRFYYTPYTSADAFWSNEQSRWSKKLDEYASPTPAIKNAATELTASLPTAEAKAQKLYEIVQSMENTDFTRAKTEAERQQLHLKKNVKRAEDVLNEKSGSGNDLAALYLALARGAGLDAYGMQVADRENRIFDPNYLSLDQLDSRLVVVRIDGKDVYLDPGEKLCPFGQLAWQHTLAGGLSQAGKGPAYTPANLTKDAITAHAANLVLDSAGAVTGTVQVVMNGPEALRWRQLNITSDSTEVQKQFMEWVHTLLPAGLDGEVDKFQGLETSAGYFSAVIKVNGRLGTVTGKRILLPAFVFSQGERLQFVSEEKREAPVDLHFAEQVIDDVIYHVPAGYTVESAPQAAQIPWSDGAQAKAQLVVKTQPGQGTIEVKHTFARFFVMLDSKDYAALRDYYQKLAANDQQQVVLAQSAAAGN